MSRVKSYGKRKKRAELYSTFILDFIKLYRVSQDEKKAPQIIFEGRNFMGVLGDSITT